MLAWKTTIPLFNEFWSIQEYSQFQLILDKKMEETLLFNSAEGEKKINSLAYIYI